METNNQVDKTSSNYKPIFNYELIIKITLIILMPLGILAIFIAKPFLISFQKLFHREDLSKQKIKQKTLLIKLLSLIVTSIFFIILTVIATHFHHWYLWIVFYLIMGLCIPFVLIIFLGNKMNRKYHYLKIKEANDYEKALESQQILPIPSHPVKDFIAGCTSYKAWAKVEDNFFNEKIASANPVSWKHGIIVNHQQGVMVPIDVWNMHFMFAGSSGFGKSYNILKLCFGALYNKFHVCVIDGKADPKFETNLKRITSLFNVPLKVWNLKDAKKAKYNPFAEKTRIELIDMISEIFDYSLKKKRADTNIYAGETRQWITLLVDFFFTFPSLGGVTLENLRNFTIRERLEGYLKSAGGYEIEEVSSNKNLSDQEKGNRVIKRIHFKNNSAGELYRKFMNLMEVNKHQINILHNDFDELYINTKSVIDPSGISIKHFMKATNSGQCLLFQFTSNITNRTIEKILLYDFTCLAEFNEEQRTNDKKKTLLIIDEASSVFQDQEQATNMWQQFRSKQICLAIGFQEKAGLEKDGKQGLLESLINNTTTFFISRLRDQPTLEAISGIYGTRKHIMPTIQTITDEKGKLQHSGSGSLRVDEEFVWHPNTIRQLMPGDVMFSTLSNVVKNNWPEYSIQQDDIVISPLKVDNVIDTIVEFEKLKASLKPKLSQNNEQIDKILGMNEEQFAVYRKMQWNTFCQKENQPTSDMPEDFLETKAEVIDSIKQTLRGG